MAWITDNLRAAFGSLSRIALGRSDGILPNIFTHQLAVAAYMSSGMLRKVIAIPAEDRVREWRDWQADKEDIALIEAEEERLGLQAKVKAAEILRGIGGGALLLITAGDHASELKPETISEGGLVAINVVSRWQIQCVDWVDDLADPAYGTPRAFEINSGKQRQRIHPSRVVCFRGDPVPAGGAIAMEESFWGDSRLMRVYREVERSDETQAWFAALVKKAKLLRIGIPDLSNITSVEGGQARLQGRVGLIAEGENLLNATVFDAGNSEGKGGEQITDYQITWNGIPAVMDAFDQRVAAVADIPFTRLMGRSPAGMNATGDHDTDNWNRMVAAGQRLETKPCLAQIDPILLRSAGASKPEDVTWAFAPLDTPTEKEQADTFKTTMDAITALQNTGTIPDIAFSKGVQNLMAEREWMPGLDQALAEVPEAERFPEGPTEEEIRAEAKAQAEASAAGKNSAATADAWFFTDAAAKPLYVQRKLLNAGDVVAWAKDQGFTTTLPADDMHVTVLYSRTAVDPMKMGETWTSEADGGLVVKPGGPRAVEKLGENAVVLLFSSWALVSRHNEMVAAGASHDWPEYQPHVTISFSADGVDLDTIKPFTGELRFGAEIFEPLDLDWKSKVTEE